MAAVWFDEPTLSGTYVYNVAQKTPDGFSEGPIMDIDSKPIGVHKGHIVVDLTGVTHERDLRLYRTGGYLTRFTMVEDVDPGNEYIDKRTDVTIALGRKGDWDYVDAPPEGLNWLTEHRGMLFGSVGNTLYWSQPGNANAWDEINSFVIVDRDITGLASSASGLLIFMKGRIKILTGSDRNTFSLITVSNEKGTIDSHSIQEINYGALFFSEDGLCFTDGSRVQEISYNVLGPQRFDVIDSAATNRSYYALIKSCTPNALNQSLVILRYDFGKEAVFSTLSGDTIQGLGIVNGRIAHSSQDMLYDTLGESYRIMNYKSGDITEEVPTMIKEWDRVRVTGIFAGTFIVYLDGVESINQTIEVNDSNVVNLQIPKKNNKSKAISFEVIGVGLITSIEYSLTPRKTTK